jgi:CheY-like chemotaxis protein
VLGLALQYALSVSAPRPFVLVVEDDRDIRESLVDLVASRGLGVTVAADGVEALDLLRAGPRPTAVFLDKWMPRLDGMGVLTALKEDPALAAVPVVWMSADVGSPASVAEHLQKPFDMEALLEILAALREAS